MGIHHRDLHHRVVITVVCSTHSLAAPPLVAVRIDRHPLDVAPLAQRHHHVLLHDELLDRLFLQLLGNDHGAPFIGVLALHLARFPLDLVTDFLRILQQILQLCDRRQQVVVLLVQLLPFQRGQPAQLHVKYRLRLDLGQIKRLHQVVPRRFHVLAVADGFDDRVNGVKRLEQTFHNVSAVPRPTQLILRPAPDYLFPVQDEIPNQVLERQFLRLPLHQRQHDGVE